MMPALDAGPQTYARYLQLETLLSAQVPLSSGPAHNELLFITIHQVHELWFQQILHDLTAARDALEERSDLWLARHLLNRSALVVSFLTNQLDVLDTLMPEDYVGFRDVLTGGSGFQSAQFREIEFLCGNRDGAYLERQLRTTEAERTRLLGRLEAPTLWEAFVAALAEQGLSVGDEQARSESLRAIFLERGCRPELRDLADRLLDLDLRCYLWRARHVAMVERMIGTKPGTGGSGGATYLRTRLSLRFFPELWNVAGEL